MNSHRSSMSFFVILAILLSLSGETSAQPPAIGGPPVREGDFAVGLFNALELGSTNDEVYAETRLGGVGITPRNGWIADYPVTPDIVGELQYSIAGAADAGRISLDRDEALRRFAALNDEFSLSVRPYAGRESSGVEPSGEGYANPEIINQYYADEGAPVYTYYTPPQDYYYLYVFVPYPFWCRGFWFPGFFILHDFHKHIVVRNRVAFLSNHFTDIKANRVYRVDPVARFKGRTFPGIGAPRGGNFISTGVPGSSREIFNAPPDRRRPQTVGPPWGMPGPTTPAPWGSPGIKSAPPWGSPASSSPPSRGQENISPPPHRESPHGESREEMTQPPAGSPETTRPPARGGGGFMRGR